jgi:hypothetical protein
MVHPYLTGMDCEDTEEVPSHPGLTQELTGFVPCQRFVGWGGLGASLNHRMTS